MWKPSINLIGPVTHETHSILDKHENASVFQRLTLIDNQFPGASVLMHKFGLMIKVLYIQ